MLCSHTSYSKPNSPYNSYAPSSTLPPLETSSSNPPDAPHFETSSTENALLSLSHLRKHNLWSFHTPKSLPGNGESPNENLGRTCNSWPLMEDKGKGKGQEDSSRSSPSASSSQGDMADTELEGGSGQPTEQGESVPPPPPPKKKRTRTLTTPHQSAVLHALLAQV